MTKTAPKNSAIAGPTEKSQKYANSSPPKEANEAAAQAINNRKAKFAENRAEIVAGMIRNENTVTTPVTRTARVMTAPSNP